MSRIVLLFILIVFANAARADRAGVNIRIVAINDFHGHLLPDAGNADAPGGAVALAATLARLRAQVPGMVFVSTGDLIGASPLPSALANDRPTLELFRHLHLVTNTIGNHELDGGLEQLRRQQETARFPFLSSNLFGSGGSFSGMVMIEREGLRIGFVGATPRNALQPLEPDSVPGLRLGDEAASINARLPDLRALKMHPLIVLLHEGAGAQDAVIPPEGCDALAGPAREITQALDPAFDLVLSAHTHGRYACKLGQRWLAQGGSYGHYLTVADLRVDRKSGAVVEVSVRNEPVRLLAGETPDPFVVKLVDDAVAAAARIADAPVAAIPGGRISAVADEEGGSPLGRLVARAQLAAGEKLGAQLACTNPSSVPRDLVASAPGNTATYADVRAVQPYGNRLKLRRVSGAQLRLLLEQQWQGREMPVSLSCSPQLVYWVDEGFRVPAGALRLNGRVLGEAEEVLMLVNSYLARGGQKFDALVGTPEVGESGNDLDALLAWLRAHPEHR